MRRAIYPGSFDPITFGHLDVIHRAALIFDELLVAVATNDAKQSLFTIEERADMIREVLAEGVRVRVVTFDGLLVNYARSAGVFVVIRGLRAISDFEFEFQMALTNRRLEPKLETIFLTPKEDCTFVSSRIVKEVVRLGGDVRQFVPGAVAERLEMRYGKV